jgi:diaminopropionate ammonia-lyase
MTNLQNSSVPPKRKPHLNPSAREWTCKDAPDTSSIATFHQAFPQYSPTPLTALPALAAELGIRDLYVKDESRRCGLPSFKILGASWASFRAIAVHVGLSTHSELESVKRAAQRKGIVLVAATDGNHGRAVARVARILGITAQILVPKDVNYCEIDFIRDEGAEVTVLDEDYDSTVQRAKTFAAEAKSRILVQDTAFDGYEQVPQVRSFSPSVDA